LSKSETGHHVTSNEMRHDLNRLAAFAEDRLGPEERMRVTEHLALCADCRETLAAMARARGGDVTFASRDIKSPLTRPHVWLPMAAALVVATGLTVGLITSGRVTRPSTEAPGAIVPTPGRPDAQGQRTGPPTPPQEAGGRTGREQVSTPASPPPEGLLARRGGERKIGGKTFHLVAGEWIDTAYDRLGNLRVVEVRTTEDRSALLQRMPALTPYAGLGNRVTVVVDNVVYLFDVPLPR